MWVAAATFPWAVTGARPVVPPRIPWRAHLAPTAARTVRTRNGYALFDDAGRYVGMVTGVDRPRFGTGAAALLLRRENFR